LGLSFFGLTYDLDQINESKLALYKQIHQICFHGKGGYDWHTIYNMPVNIRKFIFNEIKQFYEEENKAASNTKNNSSSNSNTKVIHPGSNAPSQPSRPNNSPKKGQQKINIPIKVQYK
jgi:hypothetical protein